MCMESSRVGVYSDAENSTEFLHLLLNPLAESFATPTVPVESNSTPRFDYYTDPMSAFSANKRSKVSNQNLQSNATPWFDYYTDPMSAFSANKKRSKVSNQNSQGYFTPPSPSNNR